MFGQKNITSNNKDAPRKKSCQQYKSKHVNCQRNAFCPLCQVLVYLALADTWHFSISTQQHLLCYNWGESFHTQKQQPAAQLYWHNSCQICYTDTPSWPVCDHKQIEGHPQRMTSTVSNFYERLSFSFLCHHHTDMWYCAYHKCKNTTTEAHNVQQQ